MQKKVDQLVKIAIAIIELIGIVLKEKGKRDGHKIEDYPNL